jgi:DNA-binding GntR family transcriptional regulator
MAKIDDSLRTLRAQTHKILRDEVTAGRFEPGQRINEVEIAQELGVSRGTLREALRNLEQEGLLVGVAHRGTFMRTLSPEEAIDLCEVRLSLELSAACRLAKVMTEEKLELIEERLRALERAYREPLPFVERLRADHSFHEVICEASGNVVLLHTWRSIIGSITAMVLNVGESPMKSLQDPDSHRPLLDAIVSGDEVLIRDTFTLHFEAGELVVEAALRRRACTTENGAAPKVPVDVAAPT